ncbi:hypothetical protein RIF29_21223 [Crotalaria pallida]|uniref:Uncharacterized protein n=1 Tax=Crotalaria pallida TaxID=3830 RepID=A0AAN9I5R8_CROPI
MNTPMVSSVLAFDNEKVPNQGHEIVGEKQIRFVWVVTGDEVIEAVLGTKIDEGDRKMLVSGKVENKSQKGRKGEA